MTDHFFLFIMAVFILSSIWLRVSRSNLERNYKMQEDARIKAQKRYIDALYGRDTDRSE